MTASSDSLVAGALDRLFPTTESDPEAMLARAGASANRIRQRQAAHVRRASLVAFALLALLAGAAFAASRFDVLPWFDRSDRSSASFSIDSSRRYRGPAPQTLACPSAGPGSFSCSSTSFLEKGRRIYLFAQRVEAPPPVSRRFYLDAVNRTERKGQISHATAERARRDIAESGDDFFSALAMMNVETLSAGGEPAGRPGYELVPPQGVPMWIACAAVGGVRCPRPRLEPERCGWDAALLTPLKPGLGCRAHPCAETAEHQRVLSRRDGERSETSGSPAAY
jgi:hypothetical protein